MKKKIRLGVNVDHVATLRQVRGGTTAYPDLLKMVQLSVKGGAEQITIHLREDRRHIQDLDVQLLAEKCSVDLNLEMAVSDEIYKIGLKHQPEWVCFVPEKRAELTTEGGLNVGKVEKNLARMIHGFKKKSVRSSLFIEPSLPIIRKSAELGAEAVEFHTGHWVLQSESTPRERATKEKIWQQLQEGAWLAADLGLRVHVGHGLDFAHAKKIRALPHLVEANIGHSLICYALEWGLEESVRRMKKCLQGSEKRK